LTVAESVAKGELAPERVDLQLLHRAAYESGQLSVIVAELSRPPEVDGWKSRVQELLSGRDLPEGDAGSNSARDVQFELYVAALCRRAGYCVTLAEPDIVVKRAAISFGIAAKRPRSRRKIRRAIRKGSQQLAAADTDGVIAIDITVVHNPTSAFMVVQEPEHATDELTRIADHFLHQNLRGLRYAVDVNRVFGVMAYMGALFTLATRTHLGACERFSAMNLCGLDDARWAMFKEFVRQLSSAFPSRGIN